jgi:AcrR family transcriptional regulator
MGRPREHDDRIARALLDAAERAVDAGGPDAVSIRNVALEVGTTTRAVYSLFGSKHALLVALGSRAYEMLSTAIRELPATDDPATDLVDAGVVVFRRFALEHPSLFSIGVQLASAARRSEFGGAPTDAFAGLVSLVARLGDAGLLGGRAVRQAATEFHALCEGLAAVELRGVLPGGEEERLWRDALRALINGFAVPSLLPGPTRSPVRSRDSASPGGATRNQPSPRR